MKMAIINGKGGSGKTTISMLIAYAWAEAGHSVGVEDTDPQQTAARWIKETSSGLELVAKGKKYDTVVVDTPPRLDSPAVQSAIRSSDRVIVVTSASPADIFTSRDTAELVAKMGFLGKSRLLFNQVQINTILSRGLDETSQRIGIVALKNRVQRRQVYQHAVVMGWRSLPADARDEIFKVALEIATLPISESSRVGA